MALTDCGKICAGALFTSLILILEISCIFLPVLGLLLSASGTLIVAAAAVYLKHHVVFVYIGAGLLLMAFGPQHAVEFLMITGFVGLILGLWPAKSSAAGLLISGLGMFTGLCTLTYLLGNAAVGSVFCQLPAQASLPVFAAFSAVYPAVWRWILKRLRHKSFFKISPA